MTLPRLIGMIHLGPLPGSPAFVGQFQAVVDQAVSDAETLATAGFGGIMIENFGDAPFFSGPVPAVTVAAMTGAITQVRRVTELPLGVNVLRNDGLAALAIAAATGADMIRVNVLSGTMFTDQGIIDGQAAEIGRLRAQICPDVAILADVFVKHAAPPPGLTIAQAAIDLWERSGADAVVVSGSGTGSATDPEELKRVRMAIPDAPIFIGSGVTAGSVGMLSEWANGFIVGSTLKVGSVTNPVDADRARAFIAAAG